MIYQVQYRTISGTDTGIGNSTVPYRRLYFDNFFSNKNNIFMIMVRYSTVRTHYQYDWFEKN